MLQASSGLPRGVDRELFTFMTTFDETESVLFERNVRTAFPGIGESQVQELLDVAGNGLMTASKYLTVVRRPPDSRHRLRVDQTHSELFHWTVAFRLCSVDPLLPTHTYPPAYTPAYPPPPTPERLQLLQRARGEPD